MIKMNLSSYSGGGGGAKTAGGSKRRKGGVSQGTAAKRARASIGRGRKTLPERQSAAMSAMNIATPKRKGLPTMRKVSGRKGPKRK